MNKLEVRIVKLEPMRVVSAYGFGKEPESIAWNKLMAYAVPKGLYNPKDPPSTWGFNNPDPCEGSPNYGYEIWLPVGRDIEPDGDLRILTFHGGLYAVTTFKNLANIGAVWGQLVQWQEMSKYKCGNHQWLEELTTSPETSPEDYVFNLYLPISE